MVRLSSDTRMRHGAMMLLAATCISLAACREAANESASAPSNTFGNTTEHVVPLGNGTMLVAPKGSVARDILDWAKASGSGSRRFEFGGDQFVGKSTEPTPELRARLVPFEALIRAYPDLHAEIIGYTDATGDPAENQRISERRAARIVNELRQNGLSTVRVTSRGLGSADPIADNGSVEGRASNQRVVLVLTKES